ncbi:antiterminator Q family protein [Psychromonas aquimarina]|uniref:antiterminator Q family protein n=1 Tax=Psychromonas aquimarina TaxID=444919 RepID=UPI0004030BB1|nr:antiterminator Q family protein [Psychromonas aquimarina]
MISNNTGWLLSQWARWAKQGSGAPVGFTSPMFQDVLSEVKKPDLLFSEEEAMLIDSIIAKLKIRDREMAKALVLFYFSNGNASHVARVLSAGTEQKVNRKRVDVLVKAATAWVDACLFMREVA